MHSQSNMIFMNFLDFNFKDCKRAQEECTRFGNSLVTAFWSTGVE